MRTKIGRWGKSLAACIPETYAKDLGLEEGMDLDVSLADGAIVLRPTTTQYSLEELVSRITPKNRHDETDWGPSVGRET